MMRRTAALLVLFAACAALPAAASAEAMKLTPVKRVPFPKRSYVVDIGKDARFADAQVHLSENGYPVRTFHLRPLASSSISSAVVLAIDASDSMAGAPFEAALAAVRDFGSSRSATERVGIVAFNSDVTVVQAPTASAEALGASLAHPPQLAYGTHIYDAVRASLDVLKKAHVATASMIVLSDGVDVGSETPLADAIVAARQQGVRVFTVGLRSATYDPEPLQKLATDTGGAYYEAESAVDLAPIYQDLGSRLASQYLLEYTSSAIPNSGVILRLGLDGIGVGTSEYTAPRPSEATPFHRSAFKRFVLSSAATDRKSVV